MDETAALLERIDDRAWQALPLDLRWKIIPWAIDAGAVTEAERLLDALEQERGESVKLLELRVRLAIARNDDADLGRLLRLRAERYPSATASVQLARWLLKQGDTERAAELCDSVRVDHSSQIQVQQLRNAVDLARSQGDAVRRRLQRDLTADPDGFWPNAFMAEWLLDHDDAAAARPLLHRIVVDTIERGYDSHMLRLAALLDRAGEPGLAADLRAKAETIRGERHAELARRIDDALASLPPSTGDPDLDDAIDRFSATKRGETLTVDVPGSDSDRTVDEHADEPVTSTSEVPTVEMPLDPRVFDVLQRDFGHTDLRDGQRQVIARVMAGVDTLAIMPTGAGKSLTFQLPAMLLPGVTIVISPLIALMKDQLESLPPRVRARSTVVNSTLTFDEVQERMDDIRAGKIRLVYIAP